MADLFDILTKPTHAPIKYRGTWSPSGGSLPSLTTYKNGSLLIATTSGTISNIYYAQNSFLINQNGSWFYVDNSDRTQITVSQNNLNLNDFTGLVNGRYVFQIIFIKPEHVATASNLPEAIAGTCEVLGENNIQRYTTIENKMFTRQIGSSWVEIRNDIREDLTLLVNAQMNVYSFSPVESIS